MARSNNLFVVVVFALLILSGEARKRPEKPNKRKEPALPAPPVSPPVQVPKVFLNLSEQLYHEAMTGNYRQCSTIIATGGAVDDAVDENGRHALYWAAAGGHYAVTALLLRNGANACAVDKAGQTVAQAAEARGHTETAKLVAAACPRYEEQLQAAIANPLRFVAIDAETFWHNMCTSTDGSCFLWDQPGQESRAAQARFGAIGSLKAAAQLAVCHISDDEIFETQWRLLVRYFSILGNMMDVSREMVRLYRTNGQLMQTERFFLDGLLKRHSMRDVEDNILRTMEPRRGIDLVYVRACLTLYLRNLDRAYREAYRTAMPNAARPPALPVLGPSSGLSQCEHPLLKPFCDVSAVLRPSSVKATGSSNCSSCSGGGNSHSAANKSGAAKKPPCDKPCVSSPAPAPATAARKSGPVSHSCGAKTSGGGSGVRSSGHKPLASSVTGLRTDPPRPAFVNRASGATVQSPTHNATDSGALSDPSRLPASSSQQLASASVVSASGVADWLLHAAPPLGVVCNATVSAWTGVADVARQARRRTWTTLNATLPPKVVAFIDFSPTVTATAAFVRSLNGREALFLSTVLVLIIWTLARFLVKPVMMRFENRSRRRLPKGKRLTAIIEEMVPVAPLPPAPAKEKAPTPCNLSPAKQQPQSAPSPSPPAKQPQPPSPPANVSPAKADVKASAADRPTLPPTAVLALPMPSEPERPEVIERRRQQLQRLCLKKLDRRLLDKLLAERLQELQHQQQPAAALSTQKKANGLSMRLFGRAAD